MNSIDIIRNVAIGLSVVVIIAGALLLLPGANKYLEGIFGTGDLPDVDFQTLQLKDSPNQYLVCPQGICQNAAAHETAPVYDMPVEDLRARLFSYLDSQPDIEVQRMDLPNRQFDIIQRTPTMRFPDLVTVKFYALEDGRSTLAIYSRSLYGYSDVGTNKRRVRRWLQIIAPNES